MARKRRACIPEFKAEAVKLVTKQGYSVAEAARSLGIHETLLRSWKQALETQRNQAFPGHGKLPPFHRRAPGAVARASAGRGAGRLACWLRRLTRPSPEYPAAAAAQVMQENGSAAETARKFRRTTDSNHDLPVAENLLDRQFDPEAPNEVQVADITCIPTRKGWL